MHHIIEDLIGAEGVIEILGWSADRVYRFTRERRLPYKKRVGRVYLYSRAEIEAVREDQQIREALSGASLATDRAK